MYAQEEIKQQVDLDGNMSKGVSEWTVKFICWFQKMSLKK